MLNWLRRQREKRSPAVEDQTADRAVESAIQLQRAYWTHNPEEKAALLARYPDNLSWSELLRLHHLTCLELLSSGKARAQWMGDPDVASVAPAGETYDFCLQLTQRLLSEKSPYRARYCAIWKGEAGRSSQRPPDLQGQLWNASLTHLGCLEVIHLDSHHQPKELSFVPFDDIRGVLFAQPSILRATKIVYEDAREDEIVFVPLIYGVSWFTDDKADQDGTMTRFCCHVYAAELDMNIGVGIGHQDLVLVKPEAQDKRHLFGLGSVGEMMVALDPSDPRFDEKCRARGLDPSDLRKKFAAG